MGFGAPAGVLFDFGGTLDADGVRWAERFHHAYRAEGGTLDFEAFEPLFRVTDRDLLTDSGTRSLGFRAMVSAQARLIVQATPDAPRIDAHRVAARFHAAATEVTRRNRPILIRLRRRSRLGVVSNFTGNLDLCLAELGLSELFTTVADSAVVGTEKPDPRIFTQALADLRAAPEESWMVGDNFEADIRPANSLGLHTCWLAPANRPSPPGALFTARIARLPELVSAIETACTG